MKQQDMIVLGLAAVAVYLIAQTKKTGNTAGQTVTDKVKEIFDSAGQAFGNGWRYFNDGTTIDPQGNYYKDGQMVWQNPAIAAGQWL